MVSLIYIQSELLSVSYTHLDVYKRQAVNCKNPDPAVKSLLDESSNLLYNKNITMC